MPAPQNCQTDSNNLSAFADELFECVWPFCGVGAKGVKLENCSPLLLVSRYTLVGTLTI